ncbi:hypothetical protein [Porphyromonas gingivicanis]|uniref:hypothetical protein n=1 Tax=Porphyromonas gingivicanis TaxID=266762 RepID=UPI000B1379E2|nr:hypothetical protein [Porphyromonas gingivicanis]
MRYFYSGGFFLLVVFALFSCGAEPPRGARLQLHWKGAKGDSTELFLHLTDSLGQSSVKTIWLTDASGRETLHFPLTSTTEALLYYYGGVGFCATTRSSSGGAARLGLLLASLAHSPRLSRSRPKA